MPIGDIGQMRALQQMQEAQIASIPTKDEQQRSMAIQLALQVMANTNLKDGQRDAVTAGNNLVTIARTIEGYLNGSDQPQVNAPSQTTHPLLS